MTTRIAASDAASAQNIAGYVEVIERAAKRWWPRPLALDGRADESPQADKLWAALVESGATVVGLDESLGGIGAGAVATNAVVAAGARSLYDGGLLATAGLAVPVLNALVGTQREAAAREVAGRLVDGQRATVAVAPKVTASADGSVTGRVEMVVDAGLADVVILVLGKGEELAIVAVEPAAGVTISSVSALDETRDFADITLDHAAVLALADGDTAAVVASQVVPQLTLAVAADSIGGAAQAVAETVDYARVREQFGRKIGSFQALRHLIVDTHVGVEQAAASVRHAARASDWGSTDAGIDVHIAKALATEAYIRAAATCVQVHGGIGFTRGITAHLHVKRARANEAMFGTAGWHRARLGELLAVDVPEDW